jgi:hypothetical protein
MHEAKSPHTKDAIQTRTDFLGDGPRMMPGSVDVWRSGRRELIISWTKDVRFVSSLAVRVEKGDRDGGGVETFAFWKFCTFARSDRSGEDEDEAGEEMYRARMWRVRATAAAM